jgi:hypothetical protein
MAVCSRPSLRPPQALVQHYPQRFLSRCRGALIGDAIIPPAHVPAAQRDRLPPASSHRWRVVTSWLSFSWPLRVSVLPDRLIQRACGRPVLRQGCKGLTLIVWLSQPSCDFPAMDCTPVHHPDASAPCSRSAIGFDGSGRPRPARRSMSPVGPAGFTLTKALAERGPLKPLTQNRSKGLPGFCWRDL